MLVCQNHLVWTDIIQFNKDNLEKTSLKYQIMKKYFRSLDSQQQDDFMEKYTWLSKLRFRL